jgi:DivIVA domain-containing protein
MSLMSRHGVATGETPEETLARLNAASGAGLAPVASRSLGSRFPVVHLKEGYRTDEVDAFIDTLDQRTADEVQSVEFPTTRRRGYDEDEVDRFLNEYVARLNVAACVTEPAHPARADPAPLASARRSEAPRGRLARIPQRRWRRICVASWVGLVLWVAVAPVTVDAFWPKDSAGDARNGVFWAAVAAWVVFWVVGVSRTEHIDPSEWTTTQRVTKWIMDHLPRGH